MSSHSMLEPAACWMWHRVVCTCMHLGGTSLHASLLLPAPEGSLLSQALLGAAHPCLLTPAAQLRA